MDLADPVLERGDPADPEETRPGSAGESKSLTISTTEKIGKPSKSVPGNVP